MLLQDIMGTITKNGKFVICKLDERHRFQKSTNMSLDTRTDTLHCIVSVCVTEFSNNILTNNTMGRNSNATTKVLHSILQLRINGFISGIYIYIVLIRRDSRYYGNHLARSPSIEEGNTAAILELLLLESELVASLCNRRAAFSITNQWTRFSCSTNEREREGDMFLLVENMFNFFFSHLC